MAIRRKQPMKDRRIRSPMAYGDAASPSPLPYLPFLSLLLPERHVTQRHTTHVTIRHVTRVTLRTQRVPHVPPAGGTEPPPHRV